MYKTLQPTSLSKNNKGKHVVRFLTTLDGEVRMQLADGKIIVMDENTFRRKVSQQRNNKN